MTDTNRIYQRPVTMTRLAILAFAAKQNRRRLARVAGCTEATVCKMMTGSYVAQPKTLYALGQHFQCDPSTLLDLIDHSTLVKAILKTKKAKP